MNKKHREVGNWELCIERYLVRQVSEVLVQYGGLGDLETLTVQYNPVCIVLDINLDLHRASETEACEVWVQEEVVVKRNDVPIKIYMLLFLICDSKTEVCHFLVNFLFAGIKKRSVKCTLAGEDGSTGRTDYQSPKKTGPLLSEEGLAPVVNSGWAATQPETRGIETALIASSRPL